MKLKALFIGIAGVLLSLAFTLAFTHPFEVGGIGNGDKIPNLTMKNLQGEKFSLKSTRGELVLVYFWASWCKPCRRSMPKYVRLYKKYKDATFKNGDGFTIYSISLDKNKKAWKKASQQHNIPWETNMSDLKGWKSKAVKKFGIGSIPRSYLVNAEGIVEAKNIRDNLSFILKELKK